MLRLSMRFLSEGGNVVTVSVRNARPDLTQAEVNTLMDTIVAGNVFEVKGGAIASKKDAKLIDTQETEFEIA